MGQGVQVTLLRSTSIPARHVSRRDLADLAAFALSRQKVRGPVELTVDLTGHKRIQELNRRFRGVDRTTDVISFRDRLEPRFAPGAGNGRADRGRGIRGDIAINVRQAALQAKKMRHSTRREIRLLLIHGILHLLGYTDYEPEPRRRMFQRQNALLRAWERR